MEKSSSNKKDESEIKIFWANWFIENGYAIFPLKPYTKNGTPRDWQKTKPIKTQEEKEKLLRKLREGYNYAVLCGINNLAVLDFEDLQLVRKWLGAELDTICSRTLCVLTPHGGIHIYLRAPDIPPHKLNPVFVQNGKPIADLQSYGSYVVGPGSVINHKHCTSDKCKWKGQDKVDMYIPWNPQGQGVSEINDNK